MATTEATFLKLKGIEGESKQKGHEKEIELQSFSTTVSNAVGMGTVGVGSGAGNMGPFSCTSETCKASPFLFLWCALGTKIDEATLFVTKSDGKGGLTNFLTLKFTSVFVNSYTQDASGQDSYSLTYDELTVTYIPDEGSKVEKKFKQSTKSGG